MTIKVKLKKDNEIKENIYEDIWTFRDDEESRYVMVKHSHECFYINKDEVEQIEIK